MQIKSFDVIVVGGGPAGLAAALSARENGAQRVCIVERDTHLGGILNQCIHPGFGLHTFAAELTGPEYADRFIARVQQSDIAVLLGTMVLELQRPGKVVAISKREGLMELCAPSIVLAMGCRERPRGALNIPGTRPAGVYTAGTAQRLINIEGQMVGREVVILGSGDIGLIMARRMTYEGAKVHAVCEVMPYSSGLSRNVVQCLEDCGIPLLLSHTAVEVHGKDRVQAVTVAQVDDQRRPIAGTEQTFPCDTLLLSVGLIPENELSRGIEIEMDPVTGGPVVDDHLMTSVPGFFACGNVLHVHDLVDYVSEEAQRAGQFAAAYACKKDGAHAKVALNAGGLARYTVPQSAGVGDVTVRFRVASPASPATIFVRQGEEILLKKRKLICTPGEMETVQFQLQRTDEPVTVEVQEGRA